ALAVVILAAFIGQMRRMERSHHSHSSFEARTVVVMPHEHDDRTGDYRSEQGDAEVIVRFRSGTSLQRINRITQGLNDRLLDRFEFIDGQAVIADEDGLSPETVAAEYRNLPEVEYAEPNLLIDLDPAENAGELDDESAFTEEAEVNDDDPPVVRRNTNGDAQRPNDPLFNEQWSLLNTGQRAGKSGADVCATRAWAKTQGSRKVVVAVIDTGVDYKHQDLQKNIWTRPASLAPYVDAELGAFDDRHGFDAADNDGDPMDDNGHGTHCAGIIGAEGDNNDGIAGVNWQVEIMGLKFLSRNGSGTTKDAIECINYVVARKKAGVNVRIISASWGSTAQSRALGDAIKRAGEEGILFVAAAGNSSTDNDRQPHYPSNYPHPNVVSVAALTRADVLARFSNYGAKTVHIAAPGAEIMSTWPQNQYEEHSGTSMATPVVSGVAALILSVNPDLSVTQLRKRLLDSVDKLPALDGKVSSGGRVNAARAVNAE
ncbi:MAG TPA: S8 family serine peptidase, partial [Pyrinomonadaceae bacterium]|nr:S8 family serine peptidase [Pyrinomonadaceae bacterium]